MEFLDLFHFHFSFYFCSCSLTDPSRLTTLSPSLATVVWSQTGSWPVKQGWWPIRRPLLASACRAPIDWSSTSECRSHHSGYFKHIIQPAVEHIPEWPSPLNSRCIVSRCSLPMAVRGTLEPTWFVSDAAVSLGTLGRFCRGGIITVMAKTPA